MNEKYKLVLEYFKELNIELPMAVSHAIKDAIEEKNISNDIELYHHEHVQDFAEDLVVKKKVIIYSDKVADISIDNTYTYYGYVDYSMDEYVALYHGNSLFDLTTNIESVGASEFDAQDYVVVVRETITIKNGEYVPNHTLYIYCPESVEGI